MTSVIFPRFHVFPEGDVVALWGRPNSLNMMASYQINGQHCMAGASLLKDLPQATPAQYRALAKAMRRFGYKLHTPDSKVAQDRKYRISEMLRGYQACALWSTAATDDEDNEVLLDNEEFSEEATEAMYFDCEVFHDAYYEDLVKYAKRRVPSGGNTPWALAGHDFWLTRNGHGTGFWDRGLGKLGERLASYVGFQTNFPEVNIYLGDDGLVHAS